MEIADNQHPIDLSRKCYYDRAPQRYTRPVSSSRPLPDLIPISLFHDACSATTAPPPTAQRKHSSPVLDCVQSCNQSLFGFQLKERSAGRNQSSRPRAAVAAATASRAPKMRKSASETGLPFLRSGSGSNAGGIGSSNYLSSVPMHRNASASRFAKYAEDAGRVHDSSCFAPATRFDGGGRHGDDEVSSSSGHSGLKKYQKQGPGVSLSTIQSLRKMLDKRKSMHKD